MPRYEIPQKLAVCEYECENGHKTLVKVSFDDGPPVAERLWCGFVYGIIGDGREDAFADLCEEPTKRRYSTFSFTMG